MPGRLRAALPAVAATLGMAAVLGAVVCAVLAVLMAGDEAITAGWLFRTWAIASAVSLPLGFVFGVPLLAVVRSARQPRPTLGPEAERPEAER